MSSHIFRLCTLVSLFAIVVTRVVAQQPLPAEGDEAQLIAVLESDAEMFEKAKACQRLAIIGTARSVPALAKLLADKNLSHYARFGLESNPGPDVDAALRKALSELSGHTLVGVINSISVRRDAAAVDALIEASSNPDTEVAAAALSALGRLATPAALAELKKSLAGNEALRLTAADACLSAADFLIITRKNAEAADVLVAVRDAELPRHLNVASRFGEIRTGSENVADLMRQYLASDDNDLFRIGLELAHGLTDAETTKFLVSRLGALPVSRRSLLLHVLGERGERSALPTVLAASKSDDQSIRFAATRVLGTLGDRTAIPVLLQSAVSGDAAFEESARESLAELSGDDIDSDLAGRLASSTDREQTVLVETIGRRGIRSAIPELLKFAAGGKPDLRNAAIEALGMTVGLNDFGPLVDQLMQSSGTDAAGPLKEALSKASERMPDRDAAATVLLGRMSNASEAGRRELTDLLIAVGGKKALTALGEAAKGNNDASADSATQALGKWLNPDAAPVLLELANNGNRKYRVRCLRGYIRIIRQFGLPANQRLKMCRMAFDTATRDTERALVLDTLTRFPTAAGLKMATSHLKKPALTEAASAAAVSIAEKLVDRDAKVVAAEIAKVLAATNDGRLIARAKVVMDRASGN